jgi:hypothetical protein
MILWGNGVLPILDDGEVPVGLKVVPKSVLMNLSGPIKWIFIAVDHGLIFPQSEVRRPARVMTIHSP